MLMEKYEMLKRNISKMDSAIIAFSGGVDSSFLAKVCRDVLGNKAIAVTAVSETYPPEDLKSAKRIAKKIKIKHMFIKTNEMKNKKFIENPKNRCYFCKKELFSMLRKISKEMNITNILDGTNFDDIKDYRPGLEAKKELGIQSPLLEAKLGKEDIRKLSKKLGLETWNKPASPCFASRIAYGEKITKEKLKKIEKAERLLKDYKNARVRIHEDIARIEIDGNPSLKKLKPIAVKIKNLGFRYVTLDLEGYRTGSMNEQRKH